MGRAARFHTSTALLSLTGNVVLMSLFVELLGWPVVLANVVAVAALGVANFRAADGWVFRGHGRGPHAGATTPPSARAESRTHGVPFAITAGLVLAAAGSAFADPPADTVNGWSRYVATTERRIDAELRDGRRFLAMDFKTGGGQADRRRVRNGQVLIEPAAIGGGQAGSIDVPGGLVHHWRGYVFIPGARLADLLSNVSDPTGPRSIRQEDVLETRVLSRHTDGLRLFLKLHRRSLVSVAYNTEHDVRYRRHSIARASSRSRATRIAELDDVGLASEHERGPGQDRGFLWRMNSYWRYEAMPDGVMVEMESLTLSRGLPWGMRTAIRPLIDRVARESIERTLVTLDQRVRLAVRQAVNGELS